MVLDELCVRITLRLEISCSSFKYRIQSPRNFGGAQLIALRKDLHIPMRGTISYHIS